MSKHPDDLSHREKMALLRMLRDLYFAEKKPKLKGPQPDPVGEKFDARKAGCTPLNIFMHKRKLARQRW